MDEAHKLSSLYQLVNVPTAVWIDEAGYVRRIDEGSYAATYDLGGFVIGREDYAPMVIDWVENGEESAYLQPVGTLSIAERSSDEALAEATFKLGIYFHQQGNQGKANQYWEAAQALNPASWNYARQDWSFTPEVANDNWGRKFQGLEGKPYYMPIDGLDTAEDTP